MYLINSPISLQVYTLTGTNLILYSSPRGTNYIYLCTLGMYIIYSKYLVLIWYLLQSLIYLLYTMNILPLKTTEYYPQYLYCSLYCRQGYILDYRHNKDLVTSVIQTKIVTRYCSNILLHDYKPGTKESITYIRVVLIQLYSRCNSRVTVNIPLSYIY